MDDYQANIQFSSKALNFHGDFGNMQLLKIVNCLHISATIKAGDGLSTWIEVPAEFNLTEERPAIILTYKRGGLLPISQPKYLVLDNLRLNITTKELSTRT